MDHTRVEFLLRLYDMKKLMQKCCSFLLQAPDDAVVETSLRQSAGTLQNFYKADGFAVLEEILSETGRKKAERLQEFQDDFFAGIDQAICQELLQMLKRESYIDRSTAERFFCAFGGEDGKSRAITELLVAVCDKSCVSAPMESFLYTMKAFETYPDLCSEKDGYTYEPSEQRTFECCPICGGNGIPYYRALAYHIDTFSHPHLPVKLWMRCQSCQNLYTWKYPEEQLALSEHYENVSPNPERYLTTWQAVKEDSLRIWSNVLNQLKKYTTGTDLLEVGVGTGELLAVALELGFAADAVELEPRTAHKVADLLNIPVWLCDFLAFETDKRYSIITMGDVIEHITDPRKALEKVRKLLKDDGVLWLSTPNFESSYSRLMKFLDVMWLEPYHISYFSYRGLKKLCEECGFEVCEYDVSDRYNGSMELILKKR